MDDPARPPYNAEEQQIAQALIALDTAELIDAGTKAANDGDILRARLVDEEIETRKGEENHDIRRQGREAY